VVILWGGTNDVRSNAEKVEDIYAALCECVHIVFSHGAKVMVLLTVPEMQCELVGRGAIREKRMALNEGIKSLADSEIRPKSIVLTPNQKIVVVDVCQNIPYFDCEDAVREHFWCSDGLHMTKKGYIRTAKLIYDQLSSIIV
jgi:hypothetical protein